MQKPRLLIVEDEPAFARLISLSLGREGFDVHVVANGEDAMDLAAEIHPDAVILDLGLPGADGLSVLDELREWSDLPVVVVTGQHTTEAIRRGLDRGADDYVTKPFAPDELAARVRAVLRRRHRSRGRKHHIGEWVINLDARTIVPAAEAGPAAPRTIGRGGWRLLEALLDNPGRILYRDELLDAAFGPDYRGDSGFLQEQIRRLRRALGIPAWSEGPIRTIHGVGYAYDAADEIPAGRPRRPRDAAVAEDRPGRRSSGAAANGASSGPELVPSG
jgi:two-component system, OmpR family, KDP operon response regulator KdpE